MIFLNYPVLYGGYRIYQTTIIIIMAGINECSLIGVTGDFQYNTVHCTVLSCCFVPKIDTVLHVYRVMFLMMKCIEKV